MNRLNEYEQQKMRRSLSTTTWTHAISVNQIDPTVGSIWDLHRAGAARLRKKDPSLQYYLIVALSPEQKAHGHGVLKTTLTHREIQACFRGCNKPILKNLYDTDRWIDYIAKQTLEQTVQHNI
jgi:hypothetical protein